MYTSKHKDATTSLLSFEQLVILYSKHYSIPTCDGGTVDRALDSEGRGFDSRPRAFRQVVHTHVPLSPSSITWYRSRGSNALPLGR